ncbi:MAG: sulfite exporter TauE/SafE family protein [Acidimicrobiales bacterium]
MSPEMILSAALGVAIGLSLGALGGGGSILTVPALVYALGVSAKHATGASLLIVGLSALFGMIAHARAGRVRWSVGLTVGVVSIVGSLAGTALNRRINPELLLLLFAGLMFVVAAMMIRRDRRATPQPVARPALAPVASTARGPLDELVTLEDHVVDELVEVEEVVASTRAGKPALVAAVGVGVGFLTGFLGVGGGFIVVPSLVLILGLGLAEAVGTSLLIIAISSAFAIAERHGVHGVGASVLVPFAVAAMAAAMVGNLIAGRVPARRLNQGFIVLVILVACYVTVRSVLALG